MRSKPALVWTFIGRSGMRVLVVVLLTSTTMAYTVVMRSGRVVEIPAAFEVGHTTLTYEVNASLRVTLQLAAIDFAATDKANHGEAGSFVRRIQSQSVAARTPPPGGRKRLPMARTVTDRDLESFARAREKSELEYERRRRELGLPSSLDLQRRSQAAIEAMKQRSEQQQRKDREAEAYWRQRALVIKAETAAIDGEISYLKQRLAELPVTFGITYLNFAASSGSFGRSIVNPLMRLQASARPRVGHPRVFGSQLSAGIGFNRGIARRQLSPLARGSYPAVAVHPGQLGFPVVWGSPFGLYDFSYERTAIVVRLNELLASRAGLNGRLRALEDEARIAGAQPGWLR